MAADYLARVVHVRADPLVERVEARPRRIEPVRNRRGHRLAPTQVASHRLQVASCRLQAAGCRLQATGYRLQAAGCKLQVRDQPVPHAAAVPGAAAAEGPPSPGGGGEFHMRLRV